MTISEFTLFPPELPVWAGVLIIIISFFGSAMTAALSLGGGLLIIAVMSTVMPAAAVVPVHGIVLLGSNLSRAALLRRYLDWRIIGQFGLGVMAGGAIGAFLVADMPASALRLSIAGFILFSQWGPTFSLPVGRWGVMVAGGISTVLTLFVGASGPLITTLLTKIAGMVRQTLVATAGACMSLQHGMKVAIFIGLGFAYQPWLPLVGLSLVAGFAGTVLGAKLLHKIPEAAFRRGLKWLLTSFAVYLLVIGLGSVFVG